MRGHPWTEEEIELLEYCYADTSAAELAYLLDCSIARVYAKAAKLRLNKSAEYLATAPNVRMRPGSQIGKDCRFPKGHVPANKGLRRPGWSPGRMAGTQFKKGCRTGAAARNWLPIGTVKVNTEGYYRIKVREGIAGEASGFGNTKVWPLLNRHLWEQANGPIPRGHNIVFKDKNRAHCVLENFECISRADMARRNAMWNRYPRELALAIQLNGALKRKMRRITREQHEKQNDGSAQPSV